MSDQAIKVLVIEDDADIRGLIIKVIKGMDLVAFEAQTIFGGSQVAAKEKPDLIILDLGLPDGDGLGFINNYRTWSTNPILVLSARMQEHEKVKALDAGADDYLTKPFGTAELMARMRVLLRRLSKSEVNTPIFSFGDVRIDLSLRKVTKANEEIHLSPIEYQLLNILLTNSGKVVTHRQLLKEVWGGQHTEDNHYLRIYMGHLRQKLEDDPAQPRFLLTETGVGYRLDI
ncbi:response regulator [Polynucleobacter paneuropaeus]|jgi:two-component system KDP operon response regulator KdpE|uniref:winged helix-turn-helix domain-containing protein n=1 Tax=Polynucleobacter TaxID=44013 RepID=UPI001BFE5189|nr:MULTISPECIES: winged helix-turn-helix domain-containing protein [Polynucleobacter]MBT8553800.1 response regulator [Polynucleobacter paneuropaeus]MBT8592489.1 response regulator [Polynucleobacter paneuropaeus]MBT8603758.1 response regulator [Polynucleobacter paneuropaeus]MBT8632862.1 response regulator [Polynucleobacter paneuropaeus]MBU3562845.1 winged helix-turn-helix domain-containing protein [Polynucleobacter sp. Tro8-14-1]